MDTIDPTHQTDFRRLLGRFCTGVCIVTTRDGDDEVVGFACQSFSGLSLDPPMVLISVMSSSRTLPHLLARDEFAVSVLAEGAEDISSVVGSRAEDKFAAVPLAETPSGLPVVEGSLAWFDCSVASVVEGGDHIVILGRVRSAGAAEGGGRPLLFFEGRYTEMHDPVIAPTPSGDQLASLLTAAGPGTWF
ncbi:flavin reductase family protein [Dietzia sp. 179-F 9C3 NHS]|uniref:flavin reductase family protein n=1 Tax=Dietzia sp. 179-F 9C3 NHS TaxID=3374295 RepID=UPI00387A4FA1